MPQVFLPRAAWSSSSHLGTLVEVFDENDVLGQWTGSGYAPSAADNVYDMPAPSGGVDDAAFALALAGIGSGNLKIRLRRGTYVLAALHAGLTRCALIGAGRDATTIKLADGANITALFTCAPGATDIEIRDLTFDGNRANQTGGRGALIDLVTNSPSAFVIDGCRVTNTYTSDGIGAIGGTNGRITNNIFTQTGVVGLRLDGCSNVSVTDNYFTDWNPTGAQSAIWLLQGGVTKNCIIARNRFLNVRSGVFCIESIPTTPNTYHHGIVITDNFMDGGGFRGTGVSGYFAESVIANNVMVNGGDNAGSSSLWRNGIELFGTNCRVANNVIENGAILFSITSGYSAGSKNAIVDNTIVINQASSTGMYPIQFKEQTDFTCSGNSISVTLSGSASLTAGIGIGVHGATGTVTRAKIKDNIVRLTSGAASIGIRNLSASSSDIEIDSNVVSGFATGIGNQANSNDTNLRLLRNVLWDNTTPILNLPTGPGYVAEMNVTATGQATVGSGFAKIQLTSAALAALTTGSSDTFYQVTDGTFRGRVYFYDAASNGFYPVGTAPVDFGH